MTASLVISAVDAGKSALQLQSCGLVNASTSVNFDVSPKSKADRIVDLSKVAAGDYRLKFQIKDFPEYTFGVTVTSGAPPSIAFQNNHPACAAILSKSAHDASGKSRTIHHLMFKLKSQHDEVVFVAGWDYSGGANNTQYAMSRRDDYYFGTSYASGKGVPAALTIDDATVVTMFDFKSGQRTRWVKGIKRWHEMDLELQGAVPTHTGKYNKPANQTRRRNDDAISITHVYDYIIALGKTSPGSLRAFEMFSHAWDGGPILVNTNQDTDYDKGTKKHLRDPKDKDGRTKDFAAVNMPELKHFKAAFHTNAFVKIWGCRAVSDYRRIIRAAFKQKDPNDTFEVAFDGKRVTLTAEKVKTFFLKRLMPESYMGKLATATNLTVFGAPPGMGANLRRVKGRDYMYVDQAAYATTFKWLKKEGGKVPDSTGYIPYDP